MTAPTLAPPIPAPATPAPEDGDQDAVHLWCCHEDVAMCGEDLADADVADRELEEDELCVFCVLALREDLPCPVPGCTPRSRFSRWLRRLFP